MNHHRGLHGSQKATSGTRNPRAPGEIENLDEGTHQSHHLVLHPPPHPHPPLPLRLPHLLHQVPQIRKRNS